MKLGSVLALTAALAASGLAFADDAAPPIREFDIPTTERLGQLMYAQDQEAWKATDIARAQDPSMKPHGWIVVARPGGDVMRFIQDGASGPEALCDVTFVSGAPSSCVAPADRALSASELAQYSARTLALKSVDRPCSKTYNTIVLKDPQRDGWLVWALAATDDPDVVIVGGHYRFTISADGKTIEQKDALSKSCLKMPKPKAPPGGTVEASVVNHLLSLTPIETHVFTSLNYNSVLDVGTLDGRDWKVSGGKIMEINDGMSGGDGFAARTLASFDEHCKPILSKPVDGTPKFFIGDEIQVILPLEKADKLTVTAPEGSTAVSVMCGRTTIVPSPNDYKVLLGGLTLYILDTGQGHPMREGTLEMKSGQLTFHLIKGDALTPELDAKVNARLNTMQTAVQSKH